MILEKKSLSNTKVEECLNRDYLVFDVEKDHLEDFANRLLVSNRDFGIIVRSYDDGFTSLGTMGYKELLMLMASELQGYEQFLGNHSVIDLDSTLEDYFKVNNETPNNIVVVEKDNKIIGYIDKEEVENLHEENEERMDLLIEDILDSITDAVCIVDTNCDVVFWNKSAEKLYEINRENIYGEKLKGFFPSALLPEVLKNEKAYVNLYNSPKEGCHNLISARPLYNNEFLIGAISYDKDITEQINIAETLKETKSNLKILESEISSLSNERYAFDQIVGQNEVFRETVKFTKALSKSKINILLTGESGTGKEVLARAIHLESSRKGYFVPINCSAIPGELLESELFGYEGGAFTGASQKGKIGKFELAHGGTLFLDEIGDMPIEMQAKILRVLEDSQVSKIGSNRSKKVEVRIIAASNKDLQELIRQGKFRKDLYYRLNGVSVHLAPLRERKDDIPLFIDRFIENMSLDYGSIDIEIPEDIMALLVHYNWEGNVRELKNIVERMVILANNKGVKVINTAFIPDVIREYTDVNNYNHIDDNLGLLEIIENAEVDAIRRALSKSRGKKAGAAKILKIPRSTLYFKMDKYHMED